MRKRRGGNQPCSCKRLGQPAMLAFSFAVCSCALQQWSGDLLSPLLMVKLIGHSTFPAFSVCLFFTRKAHNAATKGRVCLWSAYHTWVGLDIDWIARKEKSEFVFWLFRQLSLAFIPTSKLGVFLESIPNYYQRNLIGHQSLQQTAPESKFDIFSTAHAVLIILPLYCYWRLIAVWPGSADATWCRHAM